MNTKEEILNYIRSKETCGALLLTGEWGCGKSYLIKGIVKEVNAGKQICMGIISLFGVDDIATLNHCVKETYLSASSGFFSKTVRKAVKGVGELIKSGAEVASVADPSCGVSAGLAKGLGSALSLNVFDYIPVKNEFGRGDKKKKFVLVFDDLERCKINIVDLLGVINDYCENKKIKTILIADESKLSIDEIVKGETYLKDNEQKQKKAEYTNEEIERSKQYKEFKEKIIFSTIKLETNYDGIIDNIINEYQESIANSNYKGYLELKASTIKQVFHESKYNNIRTVKKIIVAFERVFNLWPQELAIDFLENILYTFSADMYENAAGTLCRGEYDIKFRQGDITKKYSRYGQYNSNISLLKEWILEGAWDGDKLKEQFFERFNPKEFSDRHKFFNWPIWDLDDTTMQNGYKEALEDAYNGNCAGGRSYEWLMQRYEFLKQGGLTLQPELDYIKLEQGLDKQISKIKSGENEGDWREFFIPSDDLKKAKENNPIHYKLLKKMEYASNALVLWSNQRILLDHLKRDSLNFYEISERNRLEKLEKELCDAILENYKSKDNRGKTDLVDFFEKLILIDVYTTNPITQERVNETLNNLKYLASQINELINLEVGTITKWIHNRFLQAIDKKTETISQMKPRNED